MLQTQERAGDSTEGTAGPPGLADAQPRAGGGHRGLVLALVLFSLAAGIVALLWFVVSVSAGAAGGCGGG